MFDDLSISDLLPLPAPTPALTPERALWTAVLQRAILDYAEAGTTFVPPEDHLSARAYVRSQSQDVGSFRWITDMLCEEPEAFREIVLRHLASCC